MKTTRTGAACGFAKLAGACCFGLLAAGVSLQQAAAAGASAQLPTADLSLPAHEVAAVPSIIRTLAVATHRPKLADFELEHASQQARELADWVVDSGDNHSMPFALVDKTDAKVFVFDAAGKLRGAAPALLGLARGDDAVPGIGNRPLSSMRPEERTTPAGRFVAALDRSIHGKVILWVDYADAISMHPVITSNPAERRAQRLATPTPLDNRISYGCINVPPQFFDQVVRPAFTGTDGIVYVLPETRSAHAVFASYDVEEHTRAQNATQAMPAKLAAAGARH